MNVTDAADMTVHEYPGGSESLAPRLGMSPAVLRNKVNPNNDRNHLTLAEAVRLMWVTGDHRVLQALAGELGYVLSPMPMDESDAPVLDLVLSMGVTSGDLSRVIFDALADGVITPNEMQEIESRGHRGQAAALRLIGRLLQMVRKPAVA